MYTALVDSSVLYKVFTGNLLLFLSQTELFKICWTSDIQRECVETAIKKKPQIPRNKIEAKWEKINAKSQYS